MDTKMKIVFAVFVLVIVFYVFQFIFDYMKKKEHFTSHYFDDVEHYNDAPPKEADKKPVEPKKEVVMPETPAETKPYELRIFVLDEIEKLNITDKAVKGAVMETLFSESSMKELESMSKEQRIAKVKSVHDTAAKGGAATGAVATGAVAGAAVTAAKQAFDQLPVVGSSSVSGGSSKGIEDKLKSYFTNVIKEEPVKDHFDGDDIREKVSKASEKLDDVIDNLKEMKQILGGVGGSADDTPKAKFTLPPFPKAPENAPLIEGFENVRAFAWY